MGRALRADAGMVEWTISGHLIGFSLGQLLWGPIGDRHGRQDGHVFLFAMPLTQIEKSVAAKIADFYLVDMRHDDFDG